TVAGSRAAVPSTSRSFFGPARGAAVGADVVQCTIHSQRDAMGPPRVELLAAVSGQSSAEARIWFALTGTDPFVRDDTFDETKSSQSMGVVVRLHERLLLVYEYEYGSDISAKPPIRS